jgi:hypothetical protein
MYAKTSDGQKVFAALVIDFTTGIEGNLKVDSLKINLNDFKLDSSWNSTCFAFIAAWKHKNFDLKAEMYISKADKRSWLKGSLKPHPALYIAINHMCITQTVTKSPNFTFYKFVEAISDQAILVNSQAPKKETPRKIRGLKRRGPWSRY